MTASARRWLVALMTLLACAAAGFSGPLAAQTVKVRVGTEGTNRPFSYFTPGGALTGFDVELTQAICRAAGIDCEMVTLNYAGMIPALEEKKIDAISAGMSITEKRRKIVAFTDPIRSSGKRFVSCAPDRITGILPAALAGLTIGAQAGTTSARYFKADYVRSNLRLYKSTDDAFQDLAAGRLDLVLSQEGTGYQFIASAAGRGCAFAGPRLDDPAYFGEGIGIAVRLSDAKLAAAFDAGLRKVLADGTYKSLNAKYFPFSVY